MSRYDPLGYLLLLAMLLVLIGVFALLFSGWITAA
jgi:hypothetical protein